MGLHGNNNRRLEANEMEIGFWRPGNSGGAKQDEGSCAEHGDDRERGTWRCQNLQQHSTPAQLARMQATSYIFLICVFDMTPYGEVELCE